MANRETILRQIKVGDFFHAKSPNGAKMLCLTTAVDENTIHARRITTQMDHEFDRISGLEKGAGAGYGKIDSVAPLPPEIRDVFLDLDHRYRTSKEPGRSRLTDEEKRALLFIGSHYRSNPI